MCYHMKNFHEQWMRPIDEQARWMMSSLKEQSEMVIVDLMKLSANCKDVVDVLFSPIYTSEILKVNQIIFLTVNKKLIRESYFNRPEKKEFF